MLQVYLADEPHVAEEARELRDLFPDCPRIAEIAECSRRVEIWSRDPDPDMEHFNDFVIACEAIGSFAGAILFDPQAGELL